jgi:hypothetical protein
VLSVISDPNSGTEYENYQPITAEAVVAAAPDVVLMMTGAMEDLCRMTPNYCWLKRAFMLRGRFSTNGVVLSARP